MDRPGTQFGIRRFAPHLGFPNPDRPLFGALIQSTDPVDHLRFARDEGFRAIVDPFAAARSVAEQAAIGTAAARLGLEVGTFLFAPLPDVMRLCWGGDDPDVDGALLAHMARALEVGKRIGSSSIAILSAAAAGQSLASQKTWMADRVARMAELVGREGFTLSIEAVDRARLPGLLLLHHIADARDVVRGAAHPAARLIFDTGHVAGMEGDPIALLREMWADIAVIQLADTPGRVEIGAGTIDFPAFFAALDALGFDGVLELEHGWSGPDPDRQRVYLERLRAGVEPAVPLLKDHM